jgi:hypothetical protein
MQAFKKVSAAFHPAARRFYSTATGPALQINAARLNETLHHTCQWGAANRYGE